MKKTYKGISLPYKTNIRKLKTTNTVLFFLYFTVPSYAISFSSFVLDENHRSYRHLRLSRVEDVDFGFPGCDAVFYRWLPRLRLKMNVMSSSETLVTTTHHVTTQKTTINKVLLTLKK